MALIISKHIDCTKLIVDQTLIDSTLETAYTSVTITIYKNCCDCTGYSVPITITDLYPVNGISGYYGIVGKQITLLPALLGTGITLFPDGVYKIIITAIAADGTVTTESNCFFLDCSTSCAVAKYIKGLLKTPADVEAHLLHFGLTNGGNCNCNCDEMCYLYKKLYDIINDTDICLCNCT